jgi:hypothetical protein
VVYAIGFYLALLGMPCAAWLAIKHDSLFWWIIFSLQLPNLIIGIVNIVVSKQPTTDKG